jgi:hypothetical protein
VPVVLADVAQRRFAAAIAMGRSDELKSGMQQPWLVTPFSCGPTKLVRPQKDCTEKPLTSEM